MYLQNNCVCECDEFGVGLGREKWYNMQLKHERKNAHAETE